MWKVLVALLLIAASVVHAQNVGIVFFGRNDVPISFYAPLLQSVTHAAGTSGNAASTPAGDNPVAAVKGLRETVGVNRIIVVAHSMEVEAGVAAQSFVAEHATELKIESLVLVAGFLQRKYRPGLVACAALASIEPSRSLQHPLGLLEDGVHDCSQQPGTVKFPVPVLSIGGELDGVVRIGRMAEAAYTQRSDPHLPVVVVQELTHSMLVPGFQVAGDVPPAVVPSASPTAGIAAVAEAVRSFIAGGDLSAQRASTEALVGPLVEALVEQEGSWWLTAGTDEEHGASQWAAQAQRLLVAPLPPSWRWGEAPSTNEFRLLTDESLIPPYYRDQHRAAINIASVADRTLVSSNIAQLRYIELSALKTGLGLNGYEVIKDEKAHVLANAGFLDVADVGKAYVSAIEISTKMASRQLVFNKTAEAMGSGVAPDSVEDLNRCADINLKAYEWAMKIASPAARQRHAQHGTRLRMVTDKSTLPGPWWIYTYISYRDHKASNGTTLDVESKFGFASMSAIKYGRGTHYCKLYSPARALEWIYTDSLK